MAYPVYEGMGGIGTGTDYAVDVPYPANIDADDILIAVLGDADNDSFDTPSGWTKISEQTTNSQFSSAIYWKRATGSESGSETFTSTLSAGLLVWGAMYRFSGCIDTGTPYEDFQIDTLTQSTTATCVEMETSGAERLCVTLFNVEDNTGITGGTNWSLTHEVTTSVGSDAGIALYTQQKATAGIVTEEGVTVGGNDLRVGYTFGLIPGDSLNHYTLDATPNQTFTYTQVATQNVLHDKVLNATPATAFQLVADAGAGLYKGYRLNATPQQTFTLQADWDINFPRSYRLDAEPQQTFDLAGFAIGILRGLRLNASPQQTFALSGIATGLYKGFYLNATPQQTFILQADWDINFPRSYRLDAEPEQTFDLTGIDVTLTYNPITGYTLECDVGTFALSMKDGDLLASRMLDASPEQSFQLVADAGAGLLRGFKISATVTAFYLNADGGAILTVARVLNATPAQTFTLDGKDVILTYHSAGYTLSAGLGTFLLSGIAVGLDRGNVTLNYQGVKAFRSLSKRTHLGSLN